MNKILKVSLIIMVLLISLSGTILLSGCSKKDTKPTTEEPVTPISESIAELINKAKEITSIKYDLFIYAPDQPTISQKVWVKGLKQRIEFTIDGEPVVYFIDYGNQVSYNYSPETKTALKVEMGDISQTVEKSLLDQTESIDINSKILGSEIIEGKECTVIESGSPGTGIVKMWIWKNYGLPIKIESRGQDGILIVIEYKNIDFSPIPDDIFELPKNTHIYEY